MNTFYLSGYVVGHPEDVKAGKGVATRIEIEHVQFAGSQWESRPLVRLSARQDNTRREIHKLNVGDFITIEGTITWTQNKDRPEFWNSWFNVEKVLARVPASPLEAGQVVSQKNEDDGIPF